MMICDSFPSPPVTNKLVSDRKINNQMHAHGSIDVHKLEQVKFT